jgi:hypothetical protein
MSHFATAIAIGAIAFGARHILTYLTLRKVKEPDPVQTWESEGGAVPVASNRIAGQTSPAESHRTTLPPLSSIG